jgi:RimJ/RimL family protein N-acetyltransferase
LNFWHGKIVKLRGVEPSDADAFFAWNADSEMARHLDFVWPPVSQAQIKKEIEELSQQKLAADSFTWIIEDASAQRLAQSGLIAATIVTAHSAMASA